MSTDKSLKHLKSHSLCCKLFRETLIIYTTDYSGNWGEQKNLFRVRK